MTLSLYLQCVGMFLIGQGLTFFFVTTPMLRELYRKAGEEFSMKKYWKDDWNKIIGVQLLGALVILGLDQIIQWKPWVLNGVKWWFAGLGALGDILGARWSTYRKTAMTIIDRNTNIAKSITEDPTKPPVV